MSWRFLFAQKLCRNIGSTRKKGRGLVRVSRTDRRRAIHFYLGVIIDEYNYTY